jgi:phage shock protein PspC (stress-responsive transcriptional regulator)
MKKALHISIAKTLFTIEEDAYARLEAYLASVQRHFAGTEGQGEIIADIESRIAEQCVESGEKVITLKTVESILANMGQVEEFDDESDARPNAAAASSHKKLYRNPDDMVIAGVASGIAAFIGVDALWVRLGFILLTFATGFGIVVYLVIWLLTPQAQTGSQKLEMAGSPVTLETIKERIEEVKTNRTSTLGRLFALPFRVVGILAQSIVRVGGPVLRIVAGAVLVISALIGLFAALLGSGFLMSSETWVTYGVPLSSLLPGFLHWLVVAGVATAIVIPLVFILAGGIALLRKRGVLSGVLALGLLGVWFVSLLVSGFGAAKVAANYQKVVDASPAYQTTSHTIPLSEPFTKVVLEHGVALRMVTGTSTSLVATGNEYSLNNLDARVENRTLILSSNLMPDEGRFCLFCNHELPSLVLTTRNGIQAAEVRHGSSLRADAMPQQDRLTLALEHGAYADLSIRVSNLFASAAYGSTLNLEGTAAESTVTLEHGSYFGGRNLSVASSTVSAVYGSSADTEVSENLTAHASHGSVIRYLGSPRITESAEFGSDIRHLR